ncbi:MAG: glycoside hydrolase family 88 protein [Clostridia bacterium]|nr:glycoside hydrolase family 88 protein [Clostridia bacterium]
MSYTIEQWREIHKKITDKVEYQSAEYKDGFPDLVTEDGKYRLGNEYMWTSGFWQGMLLIAYKRTKNKKTLDALRSCEAVQRKAFLGLDKLHHDVGFMWYLSSACDYDLTGDPASKQDALNAAMVLMSRFNPRGEYLRAWNDDGDDHSKAGQAIIDCMMNLDLLYWASKVTCDGRYKNVAISHADSTMKNFIRPDGTVKHIVCYNTDTGEVEGNLTGQGYSVDSSWTRGMGWAAYGFIKAYANTKKQEYKNVSQKVIDTFVNLLGEDNIPPCDFYQPKDAGYYDSSAGAIVACAMLENARLFPEQRKYYIDEAKKLLETLTEKCADFDPETDGVLRLSTQAYHKGFKNCTLIYGDYYYYEAIDMLVKLISE